jgi:ABC-2 type transport system ATP-binding protein
LILAFTGTIQLYILDEPFITIDKEAATILYQLINNQIQQGKTILISSHQDIDPAQITLSGIFEIDNQRMFRC